MFTSTSCLGTCAQHHSADIVIKQLCKSYHQLVCLDHGKDVLLWRKGVDAVTALLENFPLGNYAIHYTVFQSLVLSHGLLSVQGVDQTKTKLELFNFETHTW